MVRFLLPIALLVFAPVLAAQVTFVEVTSTDDPYFSTPEEEDFWVNAVAPPAFDCIDQWAIPKRADTQPTRLTAWRYRA